MSGEDSKQRSIVQDAPEVSPVPDAIAQPRRKGMRRFLLPGAIGLLLLGGLGWVVFNRFVVPILAAGQMKPQPTSVRLASPGSSTIDDSADYAASLDSRQSVTLQPRVAGQISAIYVKAGDLVNAGDPILQIDAAEQRAQVSSRSAAAETAAAEVETARADVGTANSTLASLQARYQSAESNVRFNQREYERFSRLFEQGGTTQQVRDQKLNAVETSRAALQQIGADIQAQEAAIARANAQVVRNQRAQDQASANVSEGEAQLRYYTISAPFSGAVGDIPIKEGDFVTTTTQLTTVTQNQQLEVQIAIPLDRAPSLRQGLPVKLLDDQGKELQTGRISFIASNVNPTTQSVQAKAVFPNANNQLRTQQFVRARVIWSSKPGVLIPTTAISRLGGKEFVFLAAPFKDSGCPAPPAGSQQPAIEPNQLVATQKPVRLGRIVGNNQEVLEGVSQSDRFAASGLLQLQNCMPIAEDTQPAPQS
ncbi:MAG TPA: efflux RND transporter periplasmic adaptor subunit [Thermosynechococcaceae cyanobacterium]